MTKTPTRVRILMAPSSGHDDDDRPQTYAGPATVLTGLPRMIRRHELRLIVPLADSTIFEMEKRDELSEGVDDAVRLRNADQLAIERLCPPEATRADFVGRLQIDAQHPDFAVLDGETVGHDGAFDTKRDQTRMRRREARRVRASRRVASGSRCAAGTFGTATRCDR